MLAVNGLSHHETADMHTPEHARGRLVASLDRKCLGGDTATKTEGRIRGIFDKETRRKPLALAADALWRLNADLVPWHVPVKDAEV